MLAPSPQAPQFSARDLDDIYESLVVLCRRTLDIDDKLHSHAMVMRTRMLSLRAMYRQLGTEVTRPFETPLPTGPVDALPF